MNILRLYWSHFSESGQDDLLAVGFVLTQEHRDNKIPVMEYNPAKMEEQLKDSATFESLHSLTNIQY